MKIIDELNDSLPVIFCRKDVGRLTSGVIQPGTLKNYDSMGKGPRDRFVFNRNICYHKSSFIEWLRTQIKYQ